MGNTQVPGASAAHGSGSLGEQLRYIEQRFLTGVPGLKRYLVRARDNSGNLGPVASVVTKGAQVLPFAPVMSLAADPGWIGDKINVVVDGAALKLSDITAEGVFTFPVGMDFGTLRLLRLRSEIDVAALALGGLVDDRTALIDACDQVRAKAVMAAWGQTHGVPVVAVGAAGGGWVLTHQGYSQLHWLGLAWMLVAWALSAWAQRAQRRRDAARFQPAD